MRDDQGLVMPGRVPLPEHERIARLRMQDGKPLLPPPSLLHLMPGGQLPEWKVEEAVAVWNATRQELRAQPGSYEAAERLVFLSMVLAQHFQLKGDRLRQRSLLEGALDVVQLPRHRQILRGFLCRAAVRAGDLEAAEAWLRPCDPQSDDLQMDSAWRFSRAFIDTVTGNYARVVEVLGQGPHDVPIEDASDDVCAVFRANAWERMGRVDVAVNLLRDRLGVAGGSGRQTVERVIRVYADWQLCAMSWPQASSSYAEKASAIAAKRASGGIHVVFVPLGVLMFLGGLVGVGVTAGGAVGLLDVDPSAFGGLGIAGVTFVLMGVLFFGIGFAMKRSAERAAWLRVHGISGTGTIQNVQHTGLTINNVPQMEFTILVSIPGRAPYQAKAKALMGGVMAARVAGGQISVRVHPQNPSEIMMETD